MDYLVRRSYIKNFFIPLNIVATRCNELVDELISSENCKIVFANNGKLYRISIGKSILEVNEIVFNEKKKLLRKDVIMFKVKPYHMLSFSKDLKVGIFFTLKNKSLFGLWRSYLHCEIFSSSSSIFGKLDNRGEKRFKMHLKVEQLVCVEISSKCNIFVVVYICKKDEKVMCEFLFLEENAGTHDTHQLELTKIFPYRYNVWNVSFDKEDTLCLFYTTYATAVYSLKEKLLFAIPLNQPEALLNTSFLVKDSQYGDLCFCYKQIQNHENGNKEDVIICYGIEPMSLESILKFNLKDLGVFSVTCVFITCFTRTLLFVSNRNFIYVIDPFKVSTVLKASVLRTINLFDDFSHVTLHVNWTGEELVVNGKKEDQYHLKVYSLNHDYSGRNFSLFQLARNAVLSSYTSKELEKMNLPKLFRYYLGL